MTRIFLLIPAIHGCYIHDDPRSPREVMVAINTRQMEVGKGEINLTGRRQRALVMTDFDLVTVFLEPPPVELSPRHYEVLFQLAEYKRAGEIAESLGISRRTVYAYTSEMRERFGVATNEEVIAHAIEYGMLDDDEYSQYYALTGTLEDLSPTPDEPEDDLQWALDNLLGDE